MRLTFRLLFHSYRGIMTGVAIMLVGWVGLTPRRHKNGQRCARHRPTRARTDW